MDAGDNAPAHRARRLAELLEAQHALYVEVRSLSRRQQELIDGEDASALLSLLAEKQKVIAEVEALARKAAPLRSAWETERESLPAEVRGSVERAVEALRTLLEEIVAIENEGQGALDKAKSSKGKEIAKLQKGKALHKAYGGKPPPPGARFQDRSG